MRQFCNFFENQLFQFWWIILFALTCCFFLEQGIKKNNRDFVALTNQFNSLKAEEEKAFKKRDQLLLQINSESDSAWIELVLMKGLGLVPEGQTKVYFKDKND